MKYQTKVPKCIKNLPNQDEKETKKYVKKYLNIKRNMELQMIKENKKYEILQDVLKFTEPDKSREKIK